MDASCILAILSGLLGLSYAFICPEDGLFQHETRCDKYYWCVGGVPHVTGCPPGSFFSTVTNFCNWPYAVSGCSDDGARTDVGGGDWQPEPREPPQHEQEQHLNSWEQDNSRWSRQNWDSFMAKALKGAKSKVARRKREVKGVSRLSRKPRSIVKGYQCPNSYGYFRHPTQCELYVWCVDSVPRLMECQGDNRFDINIKRCNRPAITPDCDSQNRRLEPETSPLRAAPEMLSRHRRDIKLVQGYQCPNSYGYFRHPTRCNLYVRCVDAEPRELECEGDRYFDKKINFCNERRFVDGCDAQGRRTEPKSVPFSHLGVYPPTTDENDDFAGHDDDMEIDCQHAVDGLWGDPIHCSVYYNCQNGRGTKFTCSPGTFFNPRTLVCSWPGEVSDCNADGTVKDIYLRKKRSAFRGTERMEDEGRSDTHDFHHHHHGHHQQQQPRQQRQPEGHFLQTEEEQSHTERRHHVRIPDGADMQPYDCNKKDGYYPHDTDCGVYFRCVEGKPTRFACTPGTFFDPDTLSCSWPSSVFGCDSNGKRSPLARKKRSERGDHQLLPDGVIYEDFDCNKEDGYYPHDTDCEVYFRCVQGKHERFTCTPGTYFNPDTMTCSWPESVLGCDFEGKRSPQLRKKRSERGDHQLLPDGVIYEDFDCNREDGYYPHDTDCEVYFRCVQGKHERFTCTPGTYFNPDTMTCSWPESVLGCDSEGKRSPQLRKKRSERGDHQLLPDGVIYEDFDCNKEDGYYPHDTDCEVYFRCVQGKHERFTCTPGTYFNPDTMTCSWPESVLGCDSEGKRSPQLRKKRDTVGGSWDDWTKVTPEEPEELFDCPSTDGYYRHPTDCSVYYRCFQGSPTRFECKPGTFYSRHITGCAWSASVSDCRSDGTRMKIIRKRRSIFSAPGQKDPPTSDKFRCPFMDGYYRDATDCTVYYWCVNQRSTKYSCANGTFFSPKMRMCVWPAEVTDCDQQSGSRISSSPYQSKVRQFTCPSEDGYYRHPIDCATYFRCNDRKLTVYKCTPGTVFDPRNHVCSWPDQVTDCNSNGEVISSPFRGNSAAKQVNTTVPPKPSSTETSTMSESTDQTNSTEETTFQTTPVSTTRAPPTRQTTPGVGSQKLTSSSPRQRSTSKPSTSPASTTIASTTPTVATTASQVSTTKINNKVISTVTVKVKKGDNSSTSTPSSSTTSQPTHRPLLHRVNDGFGHQISLGEAYTNSREVGIASSFICPTQEGYFGDMDDCAAYFHCKDGVAYRRECGPGDFYSTLSQTCIPGELVPDCNYDDTPEANSYPEWTKDYYKSYVSEFVCPSLHGYYTDETDCTAYLECINGNAYRRSCTEGTYFDEDKSKCTWEAKNEKCPLTKAGQAVSQDISDLINSGPFVCPTREGYFRDPKTCTMFYECSEGVPKSRACGPDTLFDDIKKKCTWPELVEDCDMYGRVIAPDDNVFSTKGPSQLEKNPNGFNCPLPSGHFRDPRDCAVFYHCVKSVGYKGKCRPNHVFDLEALKCVDPELVPGCDVAPKAPLVESTSDDSAHFECPADGYFRDRQNCAVYYSCKNSVYFRLECKPGTVFSNEKKLCTWPHLVPECNENAKNDADTGTKEILSETMSELPPASEEPALAHSQHQETTNIADDMPSKLEEVGTNTPDVASPTGPSTVSSFTGEGIKRQTEKETGGESLQGETEFTCPEVLDGFYGDPVYCQKFYRCVNKKKYSFTCPSGTFFDMGRFICNFRDKVTGCTISGNRISQAGNDGPEESPATSVIVQVQNEDTRAPRCPESDGLFPHPYSCSQFMYCARYTPMILSCPKDLVYNMDKKTCDYRENVVCIRYD